MWQVILVGLIVTMAVLYAAWTLVPAVTRLRLAQVFATWARRPGRHAWLARIATRLETAARGRHGACSECGAVPGPPQDRPGRNGRQSR